MLSYCHTAKKVALIRFVFVIVCWQFLAPLKSASADELTYEELSKLVTEKDLTAVLDKPCAQLSFPGRNDLKSIMNEISSAMSASLGKPVMFFRDIAELELENVNSLEDILVTDIEIPAGRMTFASQLQHVLQQTTDPPLSYQLASGCFQITTKAKVAATFRTKIYNLDHLLTNDDLAQDDHRGTLAKDRGMSVLHSIIAQHLSRTEYLEGHRQLIASHGQYLVVVTNAQGHAITADLIGRLGDAIKEGGSPKFTATPINLLLSPNSAMPSAPSNAIRPYKGGGLQ